MGKMKFFVILIVVAIVGYSIFSNPERREKTFAAIEKSTGVSLDENTAHSIGDIAEKILHNSGDTFNDSELRRSLKRWGKETLDKLGDAQLRKLQDDLEQEAKKDHGNFDRILEKYLGKSDDS